MVLITKTQPDQLADPLLVREALYKTSPNTSQKAPGPEKRPPLLPEGNQFDPSYTKEKSPKMEAAKAPTLRGAPNPYHSYISTKHYSSNGQSILS